VAAASAWIAAEAASAQHLYLYPAPFPSEQVWPNAISADGSVVVGRMQIHPFTSPASDRAAQWRPATGGFGDRFLPDHLEIGRSEATGVSEDGGVIAGNVTVGTRNNVFVKTPQGISLPNPFENEPYGGPGTGIQLAHRGCVSADGEWIAGRAGTNSPDFSEYTVWAFRMRPSGFAEPIRLATFPGGPGLGNTAIPWAISADGFHLVGRLATSRDSAWHWGPGIDDVYALGDSATAVATSANGNVFAVDLQFSSPFSTHVALVGGPNQGVLANPFGADHMYCTSMSADGQTVCGTWQNQLNTQGGGWIWKPTTGMVEAVSYFATFPELDVSMFDWMQVYAISMDGMVLAGYGFTTQGYFRAFTVDLRKDTDGDGLFDHWETDGVPYISSFDGVRRLMLPGANPLRKDIYVEIDTMEGVGPSQAALQRVRDAFDNAPVPAPNVPGGLPGIALHAEVDDDYIPLSLTPFDIPLYEAHREAYFGTTEERDDEFDYERIVKVKKQIYRYCFFSRSIVAGNLGVAETTTLLNEFGERYGSDDMMIGLGAYTPVPGTTLDDIYASTFMHELGHSLGLWHGGMSRTQNYNPNHYSVMNYTWSGVRNFGPLAQSPHLHLDYSRGPLNVLNEDLLFEFEGIGGNSSIRVPIVVRASITEGLCLEPPTNHGVCHRTNEQNIPYTCVNFAPMGGPVDWDNDRIISRDNPVCADANGLREHSYHDIMESCNEWDLIAYSFKGSPLTTGAFLSGLGDNPCPTEAQENYLATLPAPPPDDPCTGLPPGVSTPTPASAASCGEATVRFSADFIGAGPGFAQWRWWNAALPVPAWVDFSEGQMPGGTLVTGSTGGTLALQSARIADFGANEILISCRITDACGLSADSPSCTLVLGEVSAEIASAAGGGACPGGAVEFSVSATAESGPISYEWVALQSSTLIFANGVMPHGTLVQGADTNTLRLSNVAWADFDGAEWTALACRVSNACSAVEVGPFHFSALGVGIIRHPDQVLLDCEGASSVVFRAEAVAAAPASFRWTRNDVPLENDGRITGADTLTLTIAPPEPSDSGQYACVVTGACGSATTYAAPLHFGPPQLERDPPFVIPACIGSTVNLSVQPLGTLFVTARWMRNGVDIVNDERHYGADTWSFTIVGTEPADFTASFSVRLQNSCGTFVSQARLIPEHQPIEFAAQPQSRSICPGGVAMLTAPPVVEQGSFVIWQVENPTDPNSWDDVDGGPLPGVGDCWTSQFPAPYTLSVWSSGDSECPSSIRLRCAHYAECEGFVLSGVATVKICCGDVNSDGSVGLTDLSLLLAAFGTSSGDPAYQVGADFNGSGSVDLSDLSVLLANFGTTCP